MHVTGPVPARIAAELERDFDLVDDAVGADGVLALLARPSTTRISRRPGRS